MWGGGGGSGPEGDSIAVIEFYSIISLMRLFRLNIHDRDKMSTILTIQSQRSWEVDSQNQIFSFTSTMPCLLLHKVHNACMLEFLKQLVAHIFHKIPTN